MSTAEMGAAPRPTPAISWDWSEALRGSLCALPALALLPAGGLSLALCFAIGTLPVAMLGVPLRRRARPRLFAVGVAFSAAYALGCVVGE